MEKTLKISVFDTIKVTTAVIAAATTIAFAHTDVMADYVDYSQLKRADNQPGWFADIDISVNENVTVSEKVYAGEPLVPGDWAERIKITIDQDKILEDLVDFPLPIVISASAGQNNDDLTAIFDELTSDANRKKIAVTLGDEVTQCFVEIEHWDDASEVAYLHVKVPYISSSADTDLYIYFDSTQSDNDAYVGDTGDAIAENVWNSDFLRVWHLNQDPTGGAGCIFDSTGNYDATPSGAGWASGDLVDGLFGKGLNFKGTNERINIDACGLDLATAFTVTTVFHADVVPASAYRGLFARGVTADRVPWQFINQSSALISHSVELSNNQVVSPSTTTVQGTDEIIDLSFGPGYALTYTDYFGDIQNWTDGSVGNSVVSLVEFQKRNCVKFDTGVATSPNYAYIYRDAGTFQNTVDIEITLYHEALGNAINDYVRLSFYKAGVQLSVKIKEDGIYIYNGTAYVEVGTDEVSIGEWQTWRFVCDMSTPASATCDVYLNGSLIESGVDCSYTGTYTEGQVELAQHGYTTDNRIIYIDELKIGDGSSNSAVNLRQNGKAINKSYRTTGTALKTSGGSNYIGQISGYSYWDGTISEVRVMSVDITESWSRATNSGFRDDLLTFETGGDLSISVFDTVTVTESVSAEVSAPGTLEINVFDTVTVTESVSAEIETAPTLSINVFDTITVTESVSVTLPTLKISVFDSVTVDDLASVEIEGLPATINISVFDTITVSEAVSANNDLDIWRTDEVSGTGTEHLDEDMSVITDWVDEDNQNGTSIQTSFEGKECLYLGSNTAVSSNWARRSRDVGTFNDRVVIEISLYHEAIGTKTNDDQFRMIVSTNDVRLLADFRSDGLYVNTGGVSYSEVGTDLVEIEEWQKWVFDCDFSDADTATADIYLNDTLVATGVDISSTGTFTDGDVELTQHGWTTDNLGTYVDYIKIHDDLLPGTINDTITVTEFASVYIAPPALDYQNWAKKLKITISSDQIDEDLYDFPVPIYLSPASGIDNDDVSAVFDELTSDANRKKIAITALDCQTQYYVEIERWDDLNEKAWLHVRIPFVSSSEDTELYLHYDSTHAANSDVVGDVTEAPATNVWEAGFALVCHMGEDPSTTTIKDSTFHAVHGTVNGGMTAGDLVDGQFGKCLDFDGASHPNDDEIEFANGDHIENMTRKTLEAIVDYAGGINFETFIAKGPWRFEFDGNTKLYYRHETPSTDGRWAVDYTIGSFQHVATTYNKSSNSNKPIIYVDGDSKTLTTDIDPVGLLEADWNDVLTIGARTGIYPNAYEGKIDEVRISSVIRSAAWIKATYEGLFDNLLKFGSEQTFGQTDIQDTIHVTDAADVVVHLAINVHDTITVTDAVQMSVEELNVFDTITVSEWVKIDTEGVFYATTMHVALSTHSPSYYGYIVVDDLNIRFSMGTATYPLYGRMGQPIITGSKPKVITEAFSAWIDIINGGKPKVLCEGSKAYIEMTGRDVKNRVSGY